MIHTLTVPLSLDAAFDSFVDLSQWWPRDYTFSKDVLVSVTIEPHGDGHCYELGPHGFRCDWGRVIAWEPPHRLGLLWQLGPSNRPEPDPEKASDVEIRFHPEGAGTRVTLEHREFERHGDGCERLRTEMDSENGWPKILADYAAYAARASSEVPMTAPA